MLKLSRAMIGFCFAILINIQLGAQESILLQPKIHLSANDGSEIKLPDTAPSLLLRSWLAAHNSGHRDSIKAFIESRYSQKFLSKINLEKHLNFYREAGKMFGRLKSRPHFIEQSDSLKIVAHFLKKGLTKPESLLPENIIVIEVDADPAAPAFLERGVGMAPLICQTREKRRKSKS